MRVAQRSLSILLLARSLEVGGAERQLVLLAKALHERKHLVRVAVFYLRGALASELAAAGIDIIDLKKRGRWDVVGFGYRLVRTVRSLQPDVLYSFLGGANVAAATVRPFARGTKLFWSVRASDMDLNQYDWAHRASYFVERVISRAPDVIIANSHAGRAFAVANGFPAERIEIVPNGIDTERFRPDLSLRSHQRRRWHINDQQTAVGVLARLDPMKDHATFLHAAAIAANERSDLYFLCIGEGPNRVALEALSKELGISERVMFTGSADPVAGLNAIDIACSSSITEGFPNSIAEAMSCGRACVVTDVGDSAMIVGETGIVVRAGDRTSMAKAIVLQANRLDEWDQGAARRRIVESFSVNAMADRTLAILSRALAP